MPKPWELNYQDAPALSPVPGAALPPDADEKFAAQDATLGLPPGFTRAQLTVESGMNPTAVSPKGAQGLAQVMPATHAAIQKRVGRSLDPSNLDDALVIHREVMGENLRKFGNAADAARAYNGGWNPSKWGNPETAAYVPKIEARRLALTASSPAAHGQGLSASPMLAATNGGQAQFTSIAPSPWEMQYDAEPAVQEAAPAAAPVATPSAPQPPSAAVPAPQRSLAQEAVRQVGLFGRAALKAVAAVPGMMSDAAIVAPVNMAFTALGKKPPLLPSGQALDGLADTAGLPQAETPTERVVQDVTSSIGSAGGTAAAAAKIATGAGSATGRAVAERLAAAPGAQLASAAGSAGAAGITREEGGGAGAQIMAGLAGGVLPSAPSMGAAGVRRAVRGGEAGRQRMAENIAAFDEAGVTPTVGQATEGRVARAIESVLSKTPGGAGVLARKAEEQAAGIGERVEQIAASAAPRASAEVTGRAIERGIKGEGGFVRRFKSRQAQLYDKLDAHLPADAPVEVERTRAALSALNEGIPDAPALSEWFKNAKIRGIEGALKDDMAGTPAVQSAIVGADGAPLVTAPAVPARTTMPYESIKRLRTLVGRELENPSLVADVPRSKWQALYAALSDDLGGAAQAAGPKSEHAWSRANAFTRAGMGRIERLDPIVGKDDPEAIFKAATSGTKEGASRLRAVMRSLLPDEQKQVAATLTRRLGMANPGQQNAAGDAFSAETFLTNLNKLSPEAKEVIFGRMGRASVPDEIAHLAKMASNMRDGSKVFANPSGTAGQATAQTMGLGAIGALATGHVGTAAGLAAAPVAANAAAKLMKNPDFVRWLAKQSDVAPALPAALLNALVQVEVDDGPEKAAAPGAGGGASPPAPPVDAPADSPVTVAALTPDATQQSTGAAAPATPPVEAQSDGQEEGQPAAPAVATEVPRADGDGLRADPATGGAAGGGAPGGEPGRVPGLQPHADPGPVRPDERAEAVGEPIGPAASATNGTPAAIARPADEVDRPSAAQAVTPSPEGARDAPDTGADSVPAGAGQGQAGAASPPAAAVAPPQAGAVAVEPAATPAAAPRNTARKRTNAPKDASLAALAARDVSSPGAEINTSAEPVESANTSTAPAAASYVLADTPSGRRIVVKATRDDARVAALPGAAYNGAQGGFVFGKRREAAVREALGTPVEPTAEPPPVAQAAVDQAATPLDTRAHEAATSPHNDLPEPTDEQKKAGNYAKGHVRIAGLDVSIENPEGSTRSGTGPDGKRWETHLKAHYGYLRRTRGADDDQVDVFIKPGTAEDHAGPVFIVDQKNADGSFDEHKIVAGTRNAAEARRLYLSNYEPGWKGLGAITRMESDEFKQWIRSGDTKDPIAYQSNSARKRSSGKSVDPPEGKSAPSESDAPAAEPVQVANSGRKRTNAKPAQAADAQQAPMDSERRAPDALALASPATPPSDSGPGRDEIKASPRNAALGKLADAIARVKDVADRVRVPDAVPLVGGKGLGELVVGDAARVLDDASYGSPPVRGKGWATRVDPGVVDLLALSPVGVPIKAAGAGKLSAKAAAQAVSDAQLAAELAARGSSNASKNAKLLIPEGKVQRPFDADYPAAAAGRGDVASPSGDASIQGLGRGAQSGSASDALAPGTPLRATIEGHPITARLVAGRRTAGGADAGLSANEIQRTADELLAVTRHDVPERIMRGDYGRSYSQGGRERIDVATGLSPEQADLVLAHEVGHLISKSVDGKPLVSAGLKKQIERIYTDSNASRVRLKEGQTITPEMFGYAKKDWDAEYFAEAVRAYLHDPNYVKTVAPDVAAYLRKRVNTSPLLKKHIQLNQAAGAVGAVGTAAAAGMGLAGPDEASARQR